MVMTKKASRPSAAASKTSRSRTTSSAGGQLRLPIEPSDAPPTVPVRRSAGTTRVSNSGQQTAERKLQEVLNRLKTAKVRCVDVETSGLQWNKNHIVGYVLSFGPSPQDSYYVPFRHLGNANVGGRNGPTTPFNWDRKLAPGEKELIAAIDRQGVLNFGHNFGFDLKFMMPVGLQLRSRCEDTQVNATILNEWQGKFTLEHCAIVNKVTAKKSQMIVDYICSKFPEAAKAPKQAMGHYWRLAGDDAMAVEYAEGDGVTTWQLRDKQMIDLRRVDTWKGEPVPTLEQVWDIESRLIPILARMSVRGIKIDEQAFSTLRTNVKAEIERLEAAFPKDFNVRSNDDLQHWFKSNGITDWPRTAATTRFPNGNPSFTKGWMEGNEPGQKIVKLKKLVTLRDTFMLPLQTEHLFNGRVHTTYNQLRGDEYGTIHGRLSSNGPNLQAVPKHDMEIGYMYRKIFVPDDGMLWAAPDYSQIEPRLLAYYSRCKVLMDGYRADPPLDAHTAAAIACNKNWAGMSKVAQKQYRDEYAKRINQTIITGGGKKVLVDKYKVDPKEVDRVWADYFRAMPEVRTIQKRMTARMEERGYIVTLLGRRCRLFDRSKSYVALNRALAGGNADVLKLKMVEVDDYLESVGRPLDMLNNCHDAVDFQFAEDNRKHYAECLRIMQDFSSKDAVIKLDVPITVDGGEGPNWGVATYGDQG